VKRLASSRGIANDRLAFEHRILQIPEARTVLDRLVVKGAGRNEVLGLLYEHVSTNIFPWRKQLRRKQREMTSLADQLNTVARFVSRVGDDPLSFRDSWAALVGLGKQPDALSLRKDGAYVSAIMRLHASKYRNQAKLLGRLLRFYAKEKRNWSLYPLIAHVWLSTGKPHDRETAQLLSAAWEAMNEDRPFSELQIKKHRQRHLYRQAAASVSQEKTVMHPADCLRRDQILFR
jgi:hypothetical protein